MKTRAPLLLSTFAALLALPAATPPARAQTPGSLDALDANVMRLGVSNIVFASAVQPDGKIIIGGDFNSVRGVPRNKIARLNADGSLDMGFDPNPDGDVHNVVVQVDGKILLAGSFATLQPNGAASATAREYVARLNPDGSLDTTFDPKPNGDVLSLAAQADGKILLGGNFSTLQPNGAATATARQYVARLNSDGSLDPSFDPWPSGYVHLVAVQANGRILLAGNFSSLQPNGTGTSFARQYIARVNAGGTIDSGFNPKPDSGVLSLAVQADGKILLGGSFNTLQPNGAASATARSKIARVNADGSLDPGFDPKANEFSDVRSMAVQADGRILVVGFYNTLQPNGTASVTTRNGIARVSTDGSLDLGFDPRPYSGSFPLCVAVQADGKILLAGMFTALWPNGEGTPTVRNLFARLNNDAATNILSAPDATQVLWQRGGGAPEVSQVTFEKSIDGGANWTALGNGTRVGATANWQLTGLTLPASGQLRARGRTTGGHYNGSSGLVESVASIGPDITVEQTVGTGLSDGSGIAFGAPNVGGSSPVKTFTIKNTGSVVALTGLTITKDGAHPGDFTVSAPVSRTVMPGNSTTFIVTFMPSATGPRTAAIHIASNVTGTKNPFDLTLTGTVLSLTNDQDGDGMSDASEFQLAALGFDWQASQPALVSTYYASANGAGLYSAAQVQALNVGVPVLQRNPVTGVFKLTIGVKKTTNPGGPFTDFPMNAPGTSVVINAQGKLEFQFTVPENAAFFRLESQ